VVEQHAARPTHDAEHLLEATRSAVVRVGHVPIPVRFGIVLTQERDARRSAPRTGHVDEHVQVVPVHGDDVVEVVEILGGDLARTSGELDSVPSGNGLGPGVWRLPHVPVARSGRIDLERFVEPGTTDEVAEDALREGGAADVAEADEEHLGGHEAKLSGSYTLGNRAHYLPRVHRLGRPRLRAVASEEEVRVEPVTFQDLGLSRERLAAIEALGWKTPTPIQRKAIPAGLAGSDVVGIAQTGTGKTAAFMIPALERIEVGKGLQVLVLCPTRELAQQVAEDTDALSKGTPIRTEAIFGGVAYQSQIDALEKGFEVIIATPGRFIDHMQSKRVDLSAVRYLVLDEADRMLDMGFRPQIEQVLRDLPRDRQTMLFSATMPHGVHDLALRITREALWIEAARSGSTAEGITELFYSVKPEKKPDLLLELISQPEWEQVLVFTRTKAAADVLEGRLQREGIPTDALHSDRHMKQRTRALERFSTGKVRVLVATDLAQRGLDVEGISHVVNYDVPLDPEDYVHRIGRTGRAGAKGTAVTFVTAADLGVMRSLEHRLGRSVERVHLPEFDYAGTPRKESGSSATRGRKSRSPQGMGSRSAADLSPEELAELLDPKP
jgi:ATP-dependent RNA helicase RhlE